MRPIAIQSRMTRRPRTGNRAFTLPEVLVVAGVIALLIAVLLPALRGGLTTATMTKAQSNLKQIGLWMQGYASENREYIVPSQFDYSAVAGTPNEPLVKVRSNPNLGVNRWKGTWTDILWTVNGLGQHQHLHDGADVEQYIYDSPDKAAYDLHPDMENPFRSPENMRRDFAAGNGVATPFGTGAHESGLPGYFAANNFFDSTPTTGNGWWVTGQIKDPTRSMYLVDSLAGETIADEPVPYDNSNPPSPTPPLEVDFRYNGVCLMLFLDGHTSPEGPWTDLAELQSSAGNRRIKITDLDKN